MPRATTALTYKSWWSLLLIIISVSFLFLFALDTSNHCLLNTARPGEPGAHDGGESASATGSGDSEGQLELEQKKEKKFSLLQRLMRKIHRDKEHDRAWIC